MKRLMETVKRVAQSEAAILIIGETGSGKEIIARAIHHYSLRSSKPWVDLNCGALPDGLVESELFGHEKGAFSGADKTRPGLFEMANTGSIFLDEVGELSLRMQVKMLRVLDAAPYYRVGGVRKIEVDVRVVAATNRNLREAIGAGDFRADLFHRLSEIRLMVPPLRERPEDIDALAKFFLHRANPDLSLSACAMRRLRSQSWPGNVRELRNVVTRAALLSNRETLYADDIEFEAFFGNDVGVSDSTDLEELERQAILCALSTAGGSQKEAATQLGISPRTLGRKLKAYAEGYPDEVRT